MKNIYTLISLIAGSIFCMCCHSAKFNKSAEKVHDTTYVVFANDSSIAEEYIIHGKDTAISAGSNPSMEYWKKQNKKSEKSTIQSIRRIFTAYIQNSEGGDSRENEDTMKNALFQLQLLDTINESDLPLLINVWMYYDLTDFDTRKLILPIFQNNGNASIIAIKNRLKYKKKWETVDSAPYSDLVELEKKLR